MLRRGNWDIVKKPMTFYWKMERNHWGIQKASWSTFIYLNQIIGIVPRCPDGLSGKRLLQAARGMYGGPELAFDKHLLPDIVLWILDMSHEQRVKSSQNRGRPRWHRSDFRRRTIFRLWKSELLLLSQSIYLLGGRSGILSQLGDQVGRRFGTPFNISNKVWNENR